MHAIYNAIASHRTRFVSELKELLAIPSISTDPARVADMKLAAEWLCGHLEKIGLTSRLFETERHPVVYADRLDAKGKPVILFYGHYDVQPVDPVEQWLAPPFEPAVKDGVLFARGASDDKGQLFTHIKAVEAWLETAGSLPVNVKFLIEGEEEIGSPHLPGWLADHPDLRSADVVVISDTAQFGPGMPSLCTGLRGLAAFEIHVKTGESDLHSGSFGGAVPNAIQILTSMLNALHSENGAVNVPGFYDEVAEPGADELRSWGTLAHSDEEFRASAQVGVLAGEAGRSTLEKLWSRPALEIIGIRGGYQGHGHKGIVPATAWAKCSMRLVPCQTPAHAIDCVRRRVMSLAPAGVHVDFLSGHGSPPVSIPVESQWVESAVRALESGFNKKPVFIREGGSISVVTRFVNDYGMPCLLLGFGQPDDHIHAPNEKFNLDDFVSGIRTSAALIAELAKLDSTL
ncbi:MAG: dipeptidase [bacterium]|nr:dipeptidase [Candidatus Sumerlaeota bacterium]